MSTFGGFLRAERDKQNLTQKNFGSLFSLSNTDISKIENDKKMFPKNKLILLAKIVKMEIIQINDLYLADKFVKESYEYQCSTELFQVADREAKYLRNKNAKQSEIKFEK